MSCDPAIRLAARPQKADLFKGKVSCAEFSVKLVILLVSAVSSTFALLSSVPVFAADLQLLHGDVPSAVAELNLQPVGQMPGTNHLNLAIGLPLRNAAALSNLLQEIYDPADPNYRRYLTPEQFTEEFGPTKQDYETVRSFAEANGLKVTATHPNRMLLDVSGSAADIERALNVTMRTYQHPAEAREFYAPDREPSLKLAVPILRISGLDNYSLPRPLHVSRAFQKSGRSFTRNLGAFSNNQAANLPLPCSPSQMATAVHRADEWNIQMHGTPSSSSGNSPQPNQNPVPDGTGSGPGGTYAGNDFRAAYVPDSLLTGAGQTVGLLQFDGYTASDIAYYIATNNLPSVTVSNVLLDGVSGLPSGNGGEVEVALDIEMAISMAPGLSAVIVYEGSDWHDILNRMATDNLAKQLSCSWYSPGTGADPVADQIWQQMASQGQSFFSASGDYGAYSGLISFPDDSPWITLVGGTTLTTSGPRGGRVSEIVWNWYNGDASAGGISTQYPIPSWQQGISMTANQGSWTMRNMPDVALTADNVYVRADGSDQNVGGTSCAAPLWAGVAALVNQQLVSYGRPTIGFANPALYALGKGSGNAAAFNDVLTGNNASFSPSVFYAAPGYDLCTGWGTPAGQVMINSLSPPDTLLITPLTAFFSSGGAGGPFTATSLTFVLTNTGNSLLNWTLANPSLWLKASPVGGTLAPGGTATSVTVGLNSNASLLPVGTYNATIWFTNSNTRVGQRRQFTLTVLAPPAITSQPADEAVLMGSAATFAANVTGGQPLYYQWQGNGTNLSDGFHFVGSRTSNLMVTNVSANEVGTYSVIVTNTAGMTISSNALLTIIQSPPVIATQPASQTDLPYPFYSASIAFSVTVWGSTPLFYQWQKNGINLTDGGNISGSGTGTLTVANPTVADEGDYSVIVGNALGSVASSNATLNVDVPCQITGQSSITVTQLVSKPVALWVTSSGSPAGSYRWLKSGNGWGSPWALADSGPGSGRMFIGSSTTNGDAAGTNGDIDTGGNAFGLHAEGGHTITVTRSLVDPIDPGKSQGFLTFNLDTGNVGVSGMAGFALCDANNGTWFKFYCQSNTYYYDIGLGQEGFPLPFSSHGLSVLLQPMQIGQPGLIWITISDEWGQGAFVSGVYGSGLPPDHLVLFNNNAGASPANDIYFNSFNYQHEHFNAATTWIRNDDAAQAAYTNGWQSGANGGTGTIPGATNDIYVIPACALTDGGTYQAIAENWWGGQMSSSILLSVIPSSGPTVPPVITVQPTSQAVTAGAMAVVSATVTGKMPFSLQWQKNGAGLNDGFNVSGSDTSTLNLKGLKDSDAGAYTVMATYLGGSVTSAPAVLTVNDLPAIAQQPASRTNNPGAMALFTVKADGASPLYYRWTKNGVALNDGGNAVGATNATLALVNVLGSDEGSYSVVVSNTFGAVFSSNASLTVLGLKPVIAVPPPSRTNNAGSTATFAVSVTGTLPLSYQWQKNGFNLADGGNILGSATAILTLSNVQASDAAAYRVAVTNGVGSVSSPIATLTVIEVAPAIVTPPRSQTAPAGSNAALFVVATGTSPLTYQWFFNSARLTNVVRTSFTITNFQSTNEGVYLAVVTNPMGSATSKPAGLFLAGRSFRFMNPGVNPSNLFNAWLVGPTGSNFVILGTTNVALPPANWTGLATNIAPYGVFNFTDTNGFVYFTNKSGMRTYRFYRGQLAP